MRYGQGLRGSSWADSIGDILRGQQPINQLVPNHPYIDTLPHMEELLAKNTRYIMLFTLQEARGILSDLIGKADDFFSYKLGGGNLKDIWDGAHTARDFTTYLNEANQLAFNFKGLGIAATTCKYNGVSYIKITGYPSLRRILNGTRYKAQNLQLLDLGIGWRGVAYNIVKGVKFCVYFSLAFRAIELIFKKEYTLVDFFGDVIMDTAKTLVSAVVAGIAGVGLVTFLPVIVTTGAVILIGILLNAELNTLDYQHHWSADLKKTIREAIIQQEKITHWNEEHFPKNPLPLYNLHN